ncbi:hypothetical protein HH310_33105 [Actinoplanes sp. TBRC 11911]|uniref:hypothetical protein n=1 Tax=Actinoplanes sp. TBRC 11911 TaxID=2729386 RepID=UPI00145F64BE|nr:hypothetical protein [Actinoplanes sp. TBRC 11911]NMO56008.1 hypothetical protein [Actinoplanes sp. TBRC 11911]
MRKKIVLVLAIGLVALGVGVGVYALSNSSPAAGESSSVREGAPGENQIPAPPRPPRQTPIAHVVVGSK